MWFNILGFNLSWLGLVLYGNNFAVIALLWLVAHIYRTNQKRAELTFIMMVSVIGIIIDSSLLQAGVFTFGDNNNVLVPFWLMVLWACFAATINHSLRFLGHSPSLQFICGLIFPPLSYIAGANLSAVTFNHPTLITYMILSIIWGGLMVSLYLLKTKIYATGTQYD